MKGSTKSKLKLVFNNNKVNKEYELVTIMLLNGLELSYNLSFWEFYIVDKEWIEFYKKDKSSIHSYFVYNIMSVKFEKKVVGNIDNKPELKPVV